MTGYPPFDIIAISYISDMVHEPSNFHNQILQISEGRRVEIEIIKGQALVVKRFQSAGSPSEMHSYAHEADILLSLGTHPNILKPVGLDTSPNDHYPYSLVFEYISPLTYEKLAQQEAAIWQSQNTSQEKVRSLEKLRALMEQICDAVIHTHSHGIIHRDIKGSNILIDPNAIKAYLADYGIAQKCNSKLGQLNIPSIHEESDWIRGSITNLAPELLYLRGTNKVSTLTDIAGLAYLVYEWFSGTAPFNSDDKLTVTISTIQKGDNVIERLAKMVGWLKPQAWNFMNVEYLIREFNIPNTIADLISQSVSYYIPENDSEEELERFYMALQQRPNSAQIFKDKFNAAINQAIINLQEGTDKIYFTQSARPTSSKSNLFDILNLGVQNPLYSLLVYNDPEIYQNIQFVYDLLTSISDYDTYVMKLGDQSLIRTLQFSDEQAIVFEACEGSFSEYRKDYQLLSATQKLEYIQMILSRTTDVAKALNFLHINGVIHRNIKPQNLLLVNERVKLSGLDYAIPSNSTYNAKRRFTLGYTAPEVLLSDTFGADADIYSLGVTIYSMFDPTLSCLNLNRRDKFKSISDFYLHVILQASDKSNPNSISLFPRDYMESIGIPSPVINLIRKMTRITYDPYSQAIGSQGRINNAHDLFYDISDTLLALR